MKCPIPNYCSRRLSFPVLLLYLQCPILNYCNMKDVYAFLTNKFHGILKDQVVVHAVCNLIGESFEPNFKGTNAFIVSQKVCDIFAKYDVTRYKTGDTGTCSIMTQELVSVLIEKGCFSLSQIQDECARLWFELYQAQYPQHMP